MMKKNHSIHVWYVTVYLPTFTIKIGKYTSPMDAMGDDVLADMFGFHKSHTRSVWCAKLK